MKNFIEKIPRRLRKYIFIPLNVKFCLIVFLFRNLFFGFSNANKMLERVSKPCVLPILKKYGAKIGENCDIETGLTFHNCVDYSNLYIGNNCHIGKNCFFDLRDKIIIKNNVVISMLCTFITHIDMSKSNLSKTYPKKSKPIIISDNCYIGVNSTILMGNNFGENSMIAAGSLVTKDIGPNTIVGGIPATTLNQVIL